MNPFPFLLMSASLTGPLPPPCFLSSDADNILSDARPTMEQAGWMPGDGAILHFPRGRGIQLAQTTIEQRVIIRIPTLRHPLPDRMAQPMEAPEGAVRFVLVEHKGPKCININKLRAVAVTSSRGVDLLLQNRSRLRALLGRNCRPADFYSGFYIQPSEDGELCAGRDKILARSGAECEITSLKRLEVEEQ